MYGGHFSDFTLILKDKSVNIVYFFSYVYKYVSDKTNDLSRYTILNTYCAFLCNFY